MLYADSITGSMERAIAETNRRRAVQQAYNDEHGIIPTTVTKTVRETVRSYHAEEPDQEQVPMVAEVMAKYGIQQSAEVDAELSPLMNIGAKGARAWTVSKEEQSVVPNAGVDISEIPILITGLERKMKDLAKSMEFEEAARVRDEIVTLRKIMGVSDGKIGVSARRKDPRRRQR